MGRAGDHPRAVDVLREAIARIRGAAGSARRVDGPLRAGGLPLRDRRVRGGGAACRRLGRSRSGAAGRLAPATAIYAAIALRRSGASMSPTGSRSRRSAILTPPLLAAPRRSASPSATRPGGAFEEVQLGPGGGGPGAGALRPFKRRLYLLATTRDRAGRLRSDRRGARDLDGGSRGRPGWGWPILVDTTHAWSASALAQTGRLSEAEAELAAYEGLEKGWRTYIGPLAAACVASLRGERTRPRPRRRSAGRGRRRPDSAPLLDRRRPDSGARRGGQGGPRPGDCWRRRSPSWTRPFPGRAGASRGAGCSPCGLGSGTPRGTSRVRTAICSFSGRRQRETLPHALRREWVRLEEPVWQALERGALEPEATIEAIAEAFPDGLAAGRLSRASGRRRAPRRARPSHEIRRSDRAGALSRLAGDPDAGWPRPPSRAEDAARANASPAPLRACWAASPWPWVVARRRLVGAPGRCPAGPLPAGEPGAAGPEDVIFDALWPGLSPPSARSSLQVAASRIRRVLDPPGAETSVIQSADRTYRLVLGDQDVVDAEEFRSAAEAALAEHGPRAAASAGACPRTVGRRPHARGALLRLGRRLPRAPARGYTEVLAGTGGDARGCGRPFGGGRHRS